MHEEMEGPRLMGSVPAPEFLRDGGNPFPMGVMNLDVRNLQQPPQPIDADTPTTTCPACNSTVPAKKFCIECGAKL